MIFTEIKINIIMIVAYYIIFYNIKNKQKPRKVIALLKNIITASFLIMRHHLGFLGDSSLSEVNSTVVRLFGLGYLVFSRCFRLYW